MTAAADSHCALCMLGDLLFRIADLLEQPKLPRNELKDLLSAAVVVLDMEHPAGQGNAHQN